MYVIFRTNMTKKQAQNIGTDGGIFVEPEGDRPAVFFRGEIIDVIEDLYIGAPNNGTKLVNSIEQGDVIRIGDEHMIDFMKVDDVFNDCRRAEKFDEK